MRVLKTQENIYLKAQVQIETIAHGMVQLFLFNKERMTITIEHSTLTLFASLNFVTL